MTLRKFILDALQHYDLDSELQVRLIRKNSDKVVLEESIGKVERLSLGLESKSPLMIIADESTFTVWKET